jgi:hypothetical protein
VELLEFTQKNNLLSANDKINSKSLTIKMDFKRKFHLKTNLFLYENQKPLKNMAL